MTQGRFDSFNDSGFDAFIESPLSARQGDQITGRLLMWPNFVGATRPSGYLGRYIGEEINPEWDTELTWTGDISNYHRIISNTRAGSEEFWRTVERPSWYDAILAGRWTGRISLVGIRAREADSGDVDPRAAPVREFLNPLAAVFGLEVTTSVAVRNIRPFNGIPPAGEHPLMEGVLRVGHWNFNGTNLNGAAAIDGGGESLANIGAQSFAREVTKDFPTGHRVSMVVSGDGIGFPIDPGVEPVPHWYESSRQLSRNFWNVPV